METLKSVSEKLKLDNIDTDNDFYKTVSHYNTRWSVKLNTLPIPEGMTFADFTPTLDLTSAFDGTCNLQPKMPPPLNQGLTGSCGGCAVANAIKYWYTNTLSQPNKPDRSILFIYYNARLVRTPPTQNYDSGCSIENLIFSISIYGTCDDSFWPFIPNNLTVQPTESAYQNGIFFNQISETRQINQDLNSIKYALCHQKYPILCGFWIYTSYYDVDTFRTGNIPYPKPEEIRLNIGHILLLTGYDDTSRKFYVQNSYGTVNWGIDGYGTIPYEYILNPTLCPNELWIIGNDVNT